MPKNGAWVLADVVAALGLRQIDVACEKCERRGRVSVARLLAEHGPDKPVPDLPKLIAGNCPRVVADLYRDQCGVIFPNLNIDARYRAMRIPTGRR